VCSTCTYPSIFAALSAVNAPDTEIKVSGGNYTNEDSCSITFSNITLTYVVPFLVVAGHFLLHLVLTPQL
jgi:hypothetical protein